MDSTGARIADMTQLLRREIQHPVLDWNESLWGIHLTLAHCLAKTPDLVGCRDGNGDWRCDPIGRSDCRACRAENVI